jgi:hypothetical protein
MPYTTPSQFLLPGASRVLQGALGGLRQTSPTNWTKRLQDAEAGVGFDPSRDIRNPYYLDLMKQQRAAGLPDPYALTESEKNQQDIVEATTKQAASDYDLETYGPQREMTAARNKARAFFEPTVTRQRQEEEAAGLREFETRYVQPKVAEAQGREATARTTAQGVIQRAQIEAQNLYDIAMKKGDVELAREALRGFARVAESRGLMDSGTFEASQGQLGALMPTPNYGQVTDDVSKAAEAMIRRYPGKTYNEMIAEIPNTFEPGEASEEELWLLREELRRRLGVTRAPPAAPRPGPTAAPAAPQQPIQGLRVRGGR